MIIIYYIVPPVVVFTLQSLYSFCCEDFSPSLVPVITSLSVSIIINIIKISTMHKQYYRNILYESHQPRCKIDLK